MIQIDLNSVLTLFLQYLHLYGTNDNYHPENSNVLPALIRRILLAKKNNDSKVIIWGTVTRHHEFWHVDGLVDVYFFLLQNYNKARLVNIGCGEDVSITEITELIAKEVGYMGSLEFNTTKPDGTPRKLMDVSKLNYLAWKFSISIKEGIKKVYEEIKDCDWSY